MEKKGIAIGNSDFDALIEGDCYYVDKSLFIRDILDAKAMVTLITRPRRFGKTLNMNMLKSFFEYNSELRTDNHNKRHLFNGLQIENAGEQYMNQFGQFPVIFLSFKELKTSSWDASFYAFKDCIYNEYQRHINIRNSEKMTEADRDKFNSFLKRDALDSDFPHSVRFLSDCLSDYYGRKVVILIDEYDVPLESAWSGDYYDKMINLIRPLFSSSLKDSKSLAFAVLTGCLRISQESIFTGLNNPVMASIASFHYSEYFGFTQPEVDEMLEYYDLMSKRDEIRDWYNGYLFGNVNVYNPWSVIKRVTDLRKYYDAYPEMYWVNTSGNDIVKTLIKKVVDSNVKTELETLMSGGTIEKAINENITYGDIYGSVDNLWNFLFFTGYLKKVSERFNNNRRCFTLAIPNTEVETIYQEQIANWFKQSVKDSGDRQAFIRALIAGDDKTAGQLLSRLLARSISYFDAAESYYHGFLTALLVGIEDYDVKSNRETGEGRTDVFMRPVMRQFPVIIVEAKIAKRYDALEEKSREALQQIEDNRYDDEFTADGYTNIFKYGIAFYKKEGFILIKN